MKPLCSQTDTVKKYIFVPHPRSEDKVNQSSLETIEKIDFAKFDMILLGGDLTYYTTISRASMDHINSVFDLGSENTLWTLGNHDLNNTTLIAEFTGRSRHYAYYNDNITFLVLDTEMGSSGFVSSHITPEQVEMIQGVIDTIVNSKNVIFLHHRLLWMIGDDYFIPKIDSVGESTRQLDTSNFNTVVFPLLQQFKNKGIRIICLGGDKSKINFQYSPEDSITYIASTMGPEFSDTVNHVVVLTHDLIKDSIYWNYISLKDVDKKGISGLDVTKNHNNFMAHVFSSIEKNEIVVKFDDRINPPIELVIFDISGRKIKTCLINEGVDQYTIPFNNKGVFIVRLQINGQITSQKIIF